MRAAWSRAETLQALRVRQHLASLLGQGDQWSSELLVSRHADLKHLLGFVASRHTAQGRQAKGDATRIRSLAHPMALGHAEKRFDGIGADRQAEVIEPEGLGGPEFEVEIGAKLPTQSGRGHGVN